MENGNNRPGWMRDADLYLACFALAVLIIVTVGGVLMRYIVNRPLGWVEEVQLWCLVWVVFMGGSAVARHGGHIAIDAFIGLFPKMLRKAAYAITQIVTIAVLVFFGYYACRHVMQMYATERATNILNIPYYIIYAVVPLSCLFLVATALRRLVSPEEMRTAVETAIEESDNV